MSYNWNGDCFGLQYLMVVYIFRGHRADES